VADWLPGATRSRPRRPEVRGRITANRMGIMRKMSEITRELELYQASIDPHRERYDRYPMCVSIETYALCNAACEFCPYPGLTRKGERMETSLFEKIIGAVIPADHPVLFNLCGVNEPFLDKRLFDFKRLINRALPGAGFLVFTNGSVLTEQHLDNLSTIKNVRQLNISFNDHRPDHYERIMRIPYPRTYRSLRRLHEYCEQGRFSFPVIASRVADGTDADDEYCSWVQTEFPWFTPFVNWRIAWMGLVEGIARDVQLVGCRQWFMLQFLATGREAFCCQDGEGKYGTGDARIANAMDIYNHPARLRVRRSVAARRDVPACAGCSFLDGSANHRPQR
jgi:hypothetical protein